MATVDVIANRSTASEILGKAYFETDTNSFIVYNGFGWVELESDGTGAAPFLNQYSADLDGTNDYVEIPTGTFDLGTDNWAFSFWFKFGSASTYGLFSIGVSGVAAIQPILYTNHIHVYGSGVDFGPMHPSAFPINTWHHFLLQKYGNTGGSQTKGYINGVLIKDGILSSTTDLGTNNNTSAVGKLKDYFSDANLPGNVDEFAYFSNSLSDGGVSEGQTAGGDVAAIYNSGVPADLTSYSPAGWWRMGDNDGGTGTTITDQGSGSNDAELKNGPTFSTDAPS